MKFFLLTLAGIATATVIPNVPSPTKPASEEVVTPVVEAAAPVENVAAPVETSAYDAFVKGLVAKAIEDGIKGPKPGKQWAEKAQPVVYRQRKPEETKLRARERAVEKLLNANNQTVPVEPVQVPAVQPAPVIQPEPVPVVQPASVVQPEPVPVVQPAPVVQPVAAPVSAPVDAPQASVPVVQVDAQQPQQAVDQQASVAQPAPVQ